MLYTANLPASLIGMEASLGSHFLGREPCVSKGHDVRLRPTQFVRPFVKSSKNDYRDAEAIPEAVGRGRWCCAPNAKEGVPENQRRNTGIS